MAIDAIQMQVLFEVSFSLVFLLEFASHKISSFLSSTCLHHILKDQTRPTFTTTFVQYLRSPF
jgi:hypothetical protein